MQNNSSKEAILKNIANVSQRHSAVFYPPRTNSEIYKPILPDAITCFINELEAINGQCVLCENEKEAILKIGQFVTERSFDYLYCKDTSVSDELKAANIPFCDSVQNFENMTAGITRCELLVARTGSVIVSSASPSGRQMNVFPPVHLVVANASQIVHYLEEALLAIQHKYVGNLPSTITTITGPSRTADIEKTLVLGAHGPKEFIVFLSKH